MNRDANASSVATARFHRSRAFHRLLVGAALALLALHGGAAHARTYSVPCDDAALLGVLGTVETNGEEDVLWLAESCTYTLDFPWIVDADGGFPEGFPVTVHGRNATISGSDEHPVFVVNPTAVLFLNGVTVKEGASDGDGGAIQNLGALTLTDSAVSDSRASRGGGIYNFVNGRLTLVRSVVSGNATTSYGGGIHNRGRLTLIDSTVSGNSVTNGDGNGGGIYSAGASARATLTNSTISGNASRFGAGVFNDEAVMVISHATITDNTATGGGNGSGIYHRNYFGGGSLKLGNSIVANGAAEFGGASECVRDPNLPSVAITPSGGNLVEDGSCEVAGALSGDPLLGPATGVPAHRPLLPGSPAVDAGANARCAGTDQRGAPRPVDGDREGTAVCDLGAYELP
ncbi:MAG: hypothetical protein DCC71_16405 [Proteobacteria bacterium]|nr:MAG: hypothetical protein DCC71_16405 [Pseudomonadota bacterium]